MNHSSHVVFDFDATLAADDGYPIGNGLPLKHFDPHAEVTGEPIAKSVALLHALRAAGYEVRILTARTEFEPVKAWCRKHLGFEIPVSNIKAPGMLMFFDDRAVRVDRNTGHVCTCFLKHDDLRYHMPGDLQ